MKCIKIIIYCLLVIGLTSFSWPTKLDKKVRTTVSKTFKVESYNLEAVRVSTTIEDNTERKINDCLFAVKTEETLMGYVYVGEAPSMKNVFDYAILFSPELTVINAKILIYREKHGRQIGMKRWLKQFFGLTPADQPSLGENVDGISGATISATSMTDAVREVLATIHYLDSHNRI